MADGVEEARALEHPLPPGMRDLLPAEAESRCADARVLVDRFALHGYRLVMPPAFELADVVERGLGTRAMIDALRFIEPDSGDVAVLRPDVTPQIARIVATRLAGLARPIRLAYEETVVRRRVGRAKKHRQIPQVGVELCGLAGVDGDVELLALSAEALVATGLSDFTLDIADAGIVHALLREVPAADDLRRALSRKDEGRLAEIAPPSLARIFVELARLHGGREAAVEATRLLRGTRAEAAADRLLALFDAAAARGLADRLRVDAGEVRDFAYYTGLIFSVFADGPGEPLGAGGRYDELLGRFGADMPAVGFAIDLDALAWARRVAGGVPVSRRGVVVVGTADDPRVEALRRRGVAAVAVADPLAARAYAEAWTGGREDAAEVWDASIGRGSIDEAADALVAMLRA